MFFSKKAKQEVELMRAFQSLFYDERKQLKKEAYPVLCFLRDEAGGRGELGRNGVPYFYDAHNRFDAHAAAFLLGKRRMFDLIVKYVSLDEKEVFLMMAKEEKKEEEILDELAV